MPYTLADAYDDLIDVQLCDLTYEEAVKAKQLIAETICKKFSDDLDVAIQRGDTYRRRALELRKQAQQRLLTNRAIQSWGWRGWNLYKDKCQQMIALRAENNLLQDRLNTREAEMLE